MHEHINKDAKAANRQRKQSKMAQNKHIKHEGGQACYHTKGKGKHVKKVQRLT